MLSTQDPEQAKNQTHPLSIEPSTTTVSTIKLRASQGESWIRLTSCQQSQGQQQSALSISQGARRSNSHPINRANSQCYSPQSKPKKIRLTCCQQYQEWQSVLSIPEQTRKMRLTRCWQRQASVLSIPVSEQTIKINSHAVNRANHKNSQCTPRGKPVKLLGIRLTCYQ